MNKTIVLMAVAVVALVLDPSTSIGAQTPTMRHSKR
jgi:hypothetical protein